MTTTKEDASNPSLVQSAAGDILSILKRKDDDEMKQRAAPLRPPPPQKIIHFTENELE